MVPITKNQALIDQPNLRVYQDDGEYADTDLILCAEDTNPSVPSAMLQAQFVKYGPLVYQFNTPEDLGAAIFAIDPNSTLDAVALYKEQVARDAARNAGTLEPSDPAPAPDANTADTPADVPNDQEPDTKFFEEQAAEDTASSTDATSTGSGIDTSGEVLGESTTTPSVDIPPEASSTPPADASSTAPIIDAGNTSSTTPDIVLPPEASTSPAIDLSTTTPE